MPKVYFKDGSIDEYSLVLEEESVQLNCYLSGSITGGTGTECSHTVDETKLGDFIAAIKCKNIQELEEKVKSYSSGNWKKLHQVIQDHHTNHWTWSDTDWGD